MTILVVGASGATGRLLVEQLLGHDHHVKVIVRSPTSLPDILRKNSRLSMITASILDLSDEELTSHVSGCDAVASCLGHNLSLKGLFGHPRWLVTDATRRLCEAIRATKPEKSMKYVLMNTAGHRKHDLNEPISSGHKLIIGLIRFLLPPQVDNEQAAEFLRTNIGQNDETIEWAAVRPDNLINEEKVSEYEVYPSPIRSAIFDAGKTSRINVAHFMAALITDNNTWEKWKGQMPVVYNKAKA